MTDGLEETLETKGNARRVPGCASSPCAARPLGHVTTCYLEVGVGAGLARVCEPPAVRAQRLRPDLRVRGENGAAGGGREDAQRQGALSPGFTQQKVTMARAG